LNGCSFSYNAVTTFNSKIANIKSSINKAPRAFGFPKSFDALQRANLYFSFRAK
jgi:hypothetical protein